MNDIHYKPSALEKIGYKVIQAKGSIADSAELDSVDFHSIQRVKKRYIYIAALTGGLSALLSALAALIADYAFAGDSAVIIQSKWYYHLTFWGVTAIVVIAEIVYLYHAALSATHHVAQHARSELTGGFSGLLGDSTRAALELPNPSNHTSGINPTKYADKRKLLLLGILYKLKVMLSNAAAKLVVSKIIIRGSVRSWIEFVAIPITAFWNAWVAYRIMQEVQLRIIGPKVLSRYIPPILELTTNLKLRNIACRAVACSVTASFTLHPNLVYLLNLCKSDEPLPENLDSHEEFIAEISALSNKDRIIILQILCIATVVDHRVRKQELQLFNKITSSQKDKEDFKPLGQAFLSGNDLTPHLNELLN